MGASIIEVDLIWDKTGAVAVVRVNGRLDITKADEFEKAVSDYLRQDPGNLVINLAGVSYMSSSGIRALLSIYRLAGEKKVRVALCEASAVVQKVLDVVEIGQVLKVLPSEAEASQSLLAD